MWPAVRVLVTVGSAAWAQILVLFAMYERARGLLGVFSGICAAGNVRAGSFSPVQLASLSFTVRIALEGVAAGEDSNWLLEVVKDPRLTMETVCAFEAEIQVRRRARTKITRNTTNKQNKRKIQQIQQQI